jgi:hypothetical protein
LIPALCALLGGLVAAALVYIATRRRDIPTIAIEAKKAEIAGAVAMNAAWSEFTAALQAELTALRGEFKGLRERCDENTRVLEAELKELRHAP